MSKSIRHRASWLVLAVAALALGACGGNNDSPQAPPPPADNSVPPASAGSSFQGFIAYIASLAGVAYDAAEPADMTAFNGPTDNADAEEPAATSADL